MTEGPRSDPGPFALPRGQAGRAGPGRTLAPLENIDVDPPMARLPEPRAADRRTGSGPVLAGH